jgi:hypothetical protein
MARIGQIIVWDPVQGKCVEIDKKTPTEGAAPAVHDDTIPDTESYATDEGRVFNSKSALMRHYREHGYECTGGDHLTGQQPKVRHKANREEIVADIREAERKIKWGMSPSTEKEKERWRREEEKFRR